MGCFYYFSQLRRSIQFSGLLNCPSNTATISFFTILINDICQIFLFYLK
ncbi:Uncharacterised protein [Acinetobacter baumannii]|nr:Uncharacterised protein [Acinetobacter baumannii]